MHTGSSIWRKYNEIRRYVINDISFAYSRKMPGGQPPSGKSYEEILTQVRKELFDQSEQRSVRDSKAVKGYTPKEFNNTWYPVEWEVFMIYGIGSKNPQEAFKTKESNGPTITPSNLLDPPPVSKKRKNRKEQRLIARGKEQEVRRTPLAPYLCQ